MSKKDSSRLTADDFVDAFGEKPTPYVANRIDGYQFDYRTLGPGERDFYIRKIVEVLCSPDVTRAGEARLGQWEAGWGEHIGLVAEGFDRAALVPKYFGKFPVVRWKQNFIAPADHRFEYRTFAAIQDWLFEKYFSKMNAVYEFGCGTGHNLLRVRDVNPKADLWGLDWTEASQKVLARLKQVGIDDKIRGHRFNFFDPDDNFAIAPGSGVYTAAALEQIGDRCQPFINYLLTKRPEMCVHIEPITELLDENNLIDYLSNAYCRKRNYLSGFVRYLKALEQDGRIKIHMARRTLIGSLFLDGYSVVAWSPVG
jgi:SAM-dependent methyltransferase